MLLNILFATALACPRNSILWELWPATPYSQTLPNLVKDIEKNKIEYGITAYVVRPNNHILISTSVPYYIDPLAESPDVRCIEQIRQRRWWKPWTWRKPHGF